MVSRKSTSGEALCVWQSALLSLRCFYINHGAKNLLKIVWEYHVKIALMQYCRHLVKVFYPDIISDTKKQGDLFCVVSWWSSA